MQVVKQRQTVFLYLPEHGGAQGQENGLAGADAAAAPPQTGGDAVAQQLPAAAGQGDDLRRLGGVIVDAQGAPCRAVAPLGGESPLVATVASVNGRAKGDFRVLVMLFENALTVRAFGILLTFY